MKAILSYLIIVKILYYCNKNASYVNLQQILRPQSFQKERNMSKEEEEAKEPPLTFSLQVHNSTIPCSKRVVLSSSLLVDIMELIKDDLDRSVIVKKHYFIHLFFLQPNSYSEIHHQTNCARLDRDG